MSKLTIHQRLDELIPKLKDARLLTNRGIGNEIGFYIFDYDAEYEPLVQEYITRLKSHLMSPPNQLILLEIDLYKTILEILAERGVLKKAFEMEASKGNTILAKTIAPLVRADRVIGYIQQQLRGNENLALVTGVGAS